MRVRFSATALTDLDKIFSYVAADNKNAAFKLVGRIYAVTILIKEYPGIGEWIEVGRFRKLSIGNYALSYEVKGGEVIIRHVRHRARKGFWEDKR